MSNYPNQRLVYWPLLSISGSWSHRIEQWDLAVLFNYNQSAYCWHTKRLDSHGSNIRQSSEGMIGDVHIFALAIEPAHGVMRRDDATFGKVETIFTTQQGVIVIVNVLRMVVEGSHEKQLKQVGAK